MFVRHADSVDVTGFFGKGLVVVYEMCSTPHAALQDCRKGSRRAPLDFLDETPLRRAPARILAASDSSLLVRGVPMGFVTLLLALG